MGGKSKCRERNPRKKTASGLPGSSSRFHFRVWLCEEIPSNMVCRTESATKGNRCKKSWQNMLWGSALAGLHASMSPSWWFGLVVKGSNPNPNHQLRVTCQGTTTVDNTPVGEPENNISASATCSAIGTHFFLPESFLGPQIPRKQDA